MPLLCSVVGVGECKAGAAAVSSGGGGGGGGGGGPPIQGLYGAPPPTPAQASTPLASVNTPERRQVCEYTYMCKYMCVLPKINVKIFHAITFRVQIVIFIHEMKFFNNKNLEYKWLMHTYACSYDGRRLDRRESCIHGHHNYLQRQNESTCWRGVAVRLLIIVGN